MAVKDHQRHFEGLNGAPTKPVPNTVSRGLKAGDASFDQVVFESGKPLVDADLNLQQSTAFLRERLLRNWQGPSGWLRARGHEDALEDYITWTLPSGVDATAVPNNVHADDTLINSVVLPRLGAMVAGIPVVVEYTNTPTEGFNIVTLSEPTEYDGTEATIKRTDFLFLEVWRALVAPSPRATGTFTVIDNGSIAAGVDTITIDGSVLTEGAEWSAGADAAATASSIANYIDVNIADITATSVGAVVTVRHVAGAAGNAVGIASSNLVAITVSGPLLTGGADRPHKPSQTQIYQHGNVLAPDGAWLDEEAIDPVIGVEASQRVQIQYRVRVTDENAGVAFKDHPDGFSTDAAGNPNIFAQGGMDVPVSVGGGASQSYPFVPADKTTVKLGSSAPAYGFMDDGLWVAGDGSATAAQELGSVDGFVYAIPLAFVFRHNNVTMTTGSGFWGWDPGQNANGAQIYDHDGVLAPDASPLGQIPAGVSDRPDGHFADVIDPTQILDLRRHVVLPGVDLAAELQYQMQSLFDGALRTWAIDSADKGSLGDGSGDVSTQHLVCNEIGRTPTAMGIPGFTSPNGDLIRNFDHIARRFGSQPVIERVTVAFWPGDRQTDPPVGPNATTNPGKYVEKNPADDDAWYEGDVLHLDLEYLNATTLGHIFDARPGSGTPNGSGMGIPDANFLAFAPAGTIITDVLNAWHDDGHSAAAIDQKVEVRRTLGLGTSHVEIELEDNDLVADAGIGDPGTVLAAFADSSQLTGSARRIFVEFEITYPIGVGTTDTPIIQLDPDAAVYDNGTIATVAGPGPQIENSTAFRPDDRELGLAPKFRDGYREIQLEYVANDTITIGVPQSGSPIGSAVTTENLVSIDNTSLRFPRRIHDDTDLDVNDLAAGISKNVDVSNTEFGSSSRLVRMSQALDNAGQTQVTVQYFAQDPIPNWGALDDAYKVSVYYRANAPQTAGVEAGDITTDGSGTLPATLVVDPLLMAEGVWTGQVGKGSVDLPFPYINPLDQIPVMDGDPLLEGDADQVAGSTAEWFFCGTTMVETEGFDVETGLVNLHAFVHGDITNRLTFGTNPDPTYADAINQRPRKDAEFRAYYPYVDESQYRPTIIAQETFGAVRHKVMVPMLVRATEDVPGTDGGLLFRKSELLLVVLTRFASLDKDNTVRFIDADNRTLAAVYRTRNLLLTVGD